MPLSVSVNEVKKREREVTYCMASLTAIVILAVLNLFPLEGSALDDV